MEGHAVISHEVLASYAADAARAVSGVSGVVDGPRRHHGVRVTEGDDSFAVEIHVALDWGSAASEVGAVVQDRVAEYLKGTAKLPSVAVDVVFVGVAAPTPG